MEIFPGDIVRVFDPSLYKDDKSTPPEMTFQKAVVLNRYGISKTYPDLIDVEFLYNNRISKKHFTEFAKKF